MSSVFEPEVVKAVLKNRFKSLDSQRKFAKEWDERVVKRFNSWTSQIKADLAPWYELQLKWAANVVTYCTYCTYLIEEALPLPVNFPVFEPRFLPPTYSHYMKRGAYNGLTPLTGCLQPLHILHPWYYPAQDLMRCPQCRGETLQWNKGWTGGLPRHVHGHGREEWAYGYQARCKPCQDQGEKSHCFAMTSPVFWQHREHWQIPAGIPLFSQRTAFARQLVDIIIEFCPKSTSGGLEEHIK
ncbi:hypothetical protein BDZ89DRAFT_775131 [Hymenopellis radicata]|nr:hypothetical protein BDZ89DRAFT_775131 [Hymenopellis radicata]